MMDLAIVMSCDHRWVLTGAAFVQHGHKGPIDSLVGW